LPPFFTVVIVNYNSRGYLAECLAALQAQRWRDFTVTVVDNGSTDESLGALDALPAGWQALRLGRNTGFAAANNEAIAQAVSPWIAFLNPDAFPEPDWLQHIAGAIARYPEADAFGSLQIDAADPSRLDGAGDVYHALGLIWRGGFGRTLAHQRGEGEVISPCAAAAVYRRGTLEALNGFDEDFFCYGEDVDLGFRLRLAGGRTIQLANAVVRHIGGASGGRRSDFALYHGMRNRLWLFVKLMPAPGFWLLAPLHGLVTLLLLLRAALLGEARIAARGLRDGLAGLGAVWRKRRRIQLLRRASPWPLLRLSLLAPLRRLPFVRPVDGEARLKPARRDGGIGIAMVSYNTGALLMTAIEAALADPAVERIVVVDNGNPPQESAALAARAAAEPRLRHIVGQGNIGFAAGSNLAVRHLDSEFLLLLNPDCVLAPEAVGVLKQELLRLRRPALLGAVMVDEQGQVQSANRRNLPTLANLLGEALRLDRLFRRWPRIEIEGPLPDATMSVPAIAGSAMFLSRENYWALGGLDSGYFLHVEDLDLCARFRAAGGDVCLVPTLRLQHGRSTSAASRLFIAWHKMRSFRRYFRKQGLGLGQRLVLEAALLAWFAGIATATAISRVLSRPRPGSRSASGESSALPDRS
jgi:GT2 family glycosyltransferase